MVILILKILQHSIICIPISTFSPACGNRHQTGLLTEPSSWHIVENKQIKKFEFQFEINKYFYDNFSILMPKK